ncbi:uncharacterized protein LOC112350372 [Selaginella moellendorffii]|uniref:uncharacterized protein LOC112350372 n=1 Tax=Selaginella moellendorffii TaxID=88036 RepID=UPI000D1CC2C5|nr:uncharacterized protein LOC112350372 [Selaginella moellendorffii]|eukprot:XP_024542218.1 uncharacterized protein LOC112350372 [Selaginella moellendorffii]
MREACERSRCGDPTRSRWKNKLGCVFQHSRSRGIVKRCRAHRGARVCQIDPAAFACGCVSSGGVGGGVRRHSAGADAQRVPDQNGEHSGVRLSSSTSFSPSGL